MGLTRPLALMLCGIILLMTPAAHAQYIPFAFFRAHDYAASVLADSPLYGYWRLNETTGTVATDSSGTGNTGMYNGVFTLAQPGAVMGGTSVAFDGFTGYVSPTNSITAPDLFSVECWFKSASTTGGKLVGMESGVSADRDVYLGTDGRVYFMTYPYQRIVLFSPGSYNDGTWHHVVATMSPAGRKIYVDGVLTATSALYPTGYPYTAGWTIGGSQLGSGWPAQPYSYFPGFIAEVAIYKSELSAERVAAHYHASGR